MSRSKLMKAVMLGLCLSAFSTGSAFAQMNTNATEPVAAIQALSPEMEALNAKQAEIDQYLFTDHAKDIEAKGILVNYTAVSEDAVEIGITPFNEENANYFYDIFGKDGIKVVEFDQSVIYETTVAMTDPAATDASAVGGEATATDVATGSEVTVTDAVPLNQADAVDKALDDVKTPGTENDGRVYKGEDGEMSIQTESTDASANESVDPIYYTTAADTSADVKTVSAAELPEAVKRGSKEESEGTSTALTVLAIAAGAAVVGGAVIATTKKKSSK